MAFPVLEKIKRSIVVLLVGVGDKGAEDINRSRHKVAKMPKGSLDEPTMSDATILVTVEDLIDRAMGPPDANIVNFKLVQAILHILARQQRLLTQRVEIRIVELRREGRKRTPGEESSESTTESPLPGKGKAKSPRRPAKKERSDTAGTREKDKAEDKGDRKEREGAARVTPREKEMIERQGQRKTTKIPEEPTRFATKQTHMMVNKEEEEKEEYITIKEKNKLEGAEKMPQKDKAEKRKQEKLKIISQEEHEKLSEKKEARAKTTPQIEREESKKYEEPKEYEIEQLKKDEKVSEKKEARAKTMPQIGREESKKYEEPEEYEIEQLKKDEKVSEKKEARAKTMPQIGREESKKYEEPEEYEIEQLKKDEKVSEKKEARAKTMPQIEREESKKYEEPEEYEIEQLKKDEKVSEKKEARAKTMPQIEREESKKYEEPEEYEIEQLKKDEKVSEKKEARAKTMPQIEREESKKYEEPEEYEIEQLKKDEKVSEKKEARAKTMPQIEREESKKYEEPEEYEIEQLKKDEKVSEKKEARAKTMPQIGREESKKYEEPKEYEIEQLKKDEKVSEKKEARAKTMPQIEREESKKYEEPEEYEIEQLKKDEKVSEKKDARAKTMPQIGREESKKYEEPKEYEIEQLKKDEKVSEKKEARAKTMPQIEREESKKYEEPEEYEIEQLKKDEKVSEKKEARAKTMPQIGREESKKYEEPKEYEIEQLKKDEKVSEKKEARAKTMPQIGREESKKYEEPKEYEIEQLKKDEKVSEKKEARAKTMSQIGREESKKYEEPKEYEIEQLKKDEKVSEKKEARAKTMPQIEREESKKYEGPKDNEIEPLKKYEKVSEKERERHEKAKTMSRMEKEEPEEKKKEEKERVEGVKMKEERHVKEKLVEKYQPKAEKGRWPAKEQESDRKKPEQRSGYDIEITEKIVDREKILVVEKAPTTRSGARSSGSIDVVTQSQFALLESAVKQLARMAAPLQLQLPDNKQLMSDVMSGAATLPDAMQTLQINSRLQAAETALVRMSGLMTQLAAAGALPDEIVEQMEALEPSLAELRTQADQLYRRDQADKYQPLTGKKSVAMDPKIARSKTPRVSKGMEVEPAETLIHDISVALPSTVSRVSRVSSMTAGVPCVTYEDMEAALKDLKDEILKCLNNMTGRATSSVETALHTAKLVAEKLDIALKLDKRISFLHSMVEDYAEQLKGFDSGLATQMLSFQEQTAQMRADLQAGLLQLENVNNNAETAAVLELTERYDELASELDSTLHAHKALTDSQAQLNAEMHSLLECMEMLREQKADRDEVLDGLRDKADSSRLAGLLTEVEFAEARADFERRIGLCYDKFERQDAVWQEAIKDMKYTTEKKAELVELLSMRDDAQRQLQNLNDKIRVLAAALGEPKAALLTRKMAEGATCGACRERALMELHEATHGAPPRLPALRPPPVGASEEPCLADSFEVGAVVERHMCHRWCGGSHTLVSESARRVQATPVEFEVATRKFVDYGDDGRLYMMEEECQPCAECNMGDEHHPAPERGAGDEVIEPEALLECTCPPTN
ncbi:trichohyalin-like [Maniola jurtina]|uniref:trichohyalin-like n=1 Tax=Maniola jurtina TaxID=191418 RepID=UPI001E68EACB|nr:trichohyalin-like [Maniola jurtina]